MYKEAAQEGGPGLPTVLCEPAIWCGQHPLSLELASEQAGTSPRHPSYEVKRRIRCDLRHGNMPARRIHSEDAGVASFASVSSSQIRVDNST